MSYNHFVSCSLEDTAGIGLIALVSVLLTPEQHSLGGEGGIRRIFKMADTS